MKRIILFVLFVCVFLIFNLDASAQCAMCKAVAETGSKEGEGVAGGLNTGILYLMAVPYLLMMTIAFIFFKKPILEKFKRLKEQYISA